MVGGDRDRFAELGESGRVDAEIDVVEVLQRHDHLGEIRHAGALAQAIDGRVEPRRAGVQTGQRVRGSQAEVVVGVTLHSHVGGLEDCAHTCCVLLRRENADRVGEPQPIRAGFSHGTRVLLEEADLRARHVLRADGHEGATILGLPDQGTSGRQQPSTVFPDTRVKVDLRRRQPDVNCAKTHVE
jgi:hypothetical protein